VEAAAAAAATGTETIRIARVRHVLKQEMSR